MLKLRFIFTGCILLIKTILEMNCAFEQGDTLTIPIKWEFT